MTGLAAAAGVAGAGAQQVQFAPVQLSEVAGWREHDPAGALAAFQRSCREIIDTGRGFSRPVRFAGKRRDWLGLCRHALELEPDDAIAARAFFETRFTALQVTVAGNGRGLFTGYYEPEVAGSLTRTAEYSVPVYGKPDDLVALSTKEAALTGTAYGRRRAGRVEAYPTRKHIETRGPSGKAEVLAWLGSWPDLFFMQIQGSGRVRLADGGVLRLTYAAKTGRAYTPIGAVLIAMGELSRAEVSMQTIRAWLKANPKRARQVMWKNESFVFFRRADLPEQDLGAYGAQRVQLTPGRSLAVDRDLWAFGMPVWLATTTPGPDARERPFHRLMIAQDTGSAITGPMRGDIYFGFGDKAGEIAGRMKAQGRMIVLLPPALARRLVAGKRVGQ